MPLIARLTPHRFHRFYNRLRGRANEDTFSTRYRANARVDIRRLADVAGLQVGSMELIERRPECLRMHPGTYLVGYAYERLVNSTAAVGGLRILLMMSCPSKPWLQTQEEARRG